MDKRKLHNFWEGKAFKIVVTINKSACCCSSLSPCPSRSHLPLPLFPNPCGFALISRGGPAAQEDNPRISWRSRPSLSSRRLLGHSGWMEKRKSCEAFIPSHPITTCATSDFKSSRHDRWAEDWFDFSHQRRFQTSRLDFCEKCRPLTHSKKAGVQLLWLKGNLICFYRNFSFLCVSFGGQFWKS